MSAAVGRPDVDQPIIGGGPAAVACAERLRELDPAASVLVTSRELDPPLRPHAVLKVLRARRPVPGRNPPARRGLVGR
jgi:NADPH-dependent 2,4-dienoyl-CoA reductase/sulfur reductase-like enzyme